VIGYTLKPEAIIFDWDDTLATNWDSIHGALNATLKAMGKDLWTKEKTRNNVRRSMRDSFPQMFGTKWEEAAKIFFQHINANHLETLEPVFFSENILSQLKIANIILGIVSNKTGDLLRTECSYLGWNDYFTAIIGANDAPRDKPSADPLFLCLQGSNIKASFNTWYVGDAVTDMECAHNGGVTGILIKDSALTPDYDEFPPHLHFKNLQEMSYYLLNM
jgi:phosphoglycolate phosphatase